MPTFDWDIDIQILKYILQYQIGPMTKGVENQKKGLTFISDKHILECFKLKKLGYSEWFFLWTKVVDSLALIQKKNIGGYSGK